eukprot:814709-Prorocentrum_minimum.AAC.1
MAPCLVCLHPSRPRRSLPVATSSLTIAAPISRHARRLQFQFEEMYPAPPEGGGGAGGGRGDMDRLHPPTAARA